MTDTITETIQQIPLEKIQPHPDNRRVGGFDPVKLQQLADSIKDVGVQQPIIVRKQLANGGFQMVAGERRWRAAKLAGLIDIPAVVRELDDLQVLKISTIENLQREDVHPLDEADGYARLLDLAGYEVEQIAQELGKSASYVYQRLKLRELIEPARRLLIDGTITAGHAVLIARLPGPQQAQVVGRSFDRRDPPSVRDLADWIQREVLMELGKASWKLDDANLLPAAGPCTLCPKRAGSTPALFADVCTGKKDYCTDRACFQAKTKATVDLRKAELKGQPHLETRSEYVGYEQDQRDSKAGILVHGAVEQCKKDDPKAQRVLDLSTGRITWGKKHEERSYRYQPTPREIAEQKRRKEQEKRDATTKRALWDAVMEEVRGLISEGAWTTELDRFIVRRFWERLWDDARGVLCKAEGWPIPEKKKGEYGRPWEKMGEAAIAAADADGLQLLMVKIALAGELSGGYWSPNGREESALETVAKMLKIDPKAIKAKAIAGMKPKGPKLVNVSADGKAAAKKKAGKKPAKDPGHLDLIPKRKRAKRGVCSVCGCTEDDCRQCIEKTGKACHWVNDEHTLCSACQPDPEGVEGAFPEASE